MKGKSLKMWVASGLVLLMTLCFLGDVSYGDDRSLNGYENWGDLVACWPGYGVYVFNGNSGTWSRIFTDSVSHLVLGDTNGDGAAEMIYVKDNAFFLYNFVTKQTTTIPTNPAQFGAISTLCTIDWNRDGKDDFFISSPEGGMWWCNAANWTWTQVTPQHSYMITAGDFDGDGKSDLLLWRSDGISFSSSKESKWIHAEGITQDLLDSLTFVTAGDLDGDKRDEMVGCFKNGVWTRDLISKKWLVQYNKKPAKFLATGDMDGDGVDDLEGSWPELTPPMWIRYSKTAAWKTFHKVAPTCFAAGVVYPSNLPPAYYFSAVRKSAFIGGSLMYNNNDPTLSHLKTKMYIPIKLSKFQKIAVENPDVVEPNSDTTEYQDIEKETIFGLVWIEDISSSSISLKVIRWDYQGNQLPELWFPALPLEKPIDLNLDGKPDLIYTNSIQRFRMTDPNVSYLKFISSEAELHATYYNYAPDVHSELNTVHGNFGFNLNGYALIRKDYMDQAAFSTAGAQTLLQVRNTLNPFYVVPGDFIIDPDKGYLKVASADYSAQLIQLEDLPASPDGLQEAAIDALVLMAYDMDDDNPYQTPPIGPTTDSSESVSTLEEYQSKRDQLFNKLNSCEKVFNVININNLNVDYYDGATKAATFSIDKFQVAVGGEICVRLGFLKIKAWHKAMSFTESIFSIKVQKPLKQELPPLIELPAFQTSANVNAGPILLTFYVNCEAGIKAGIDARDLGYFKFAKARLKGHDNGYFRAGLFYLKNDSQKFDQTLTYTGDGSTDAKIEVYLKPYVDLTVGVKAFNALYVELECEGYLKSAISFYLDQAYLYNYQFTLSSGIDIDLRAGVKIWSFNPHFTWHLYDNEWIMFQKAWSKPSSIKPDLLISSIRSNPVDPKPGSPLELFATVQNLGLIKIASGQNIVVKFKNEDTGAIIGQFTLNDGLEKGQEIEGKCNAVFQIPSDADHLNISAMVDPGGLIPELDENNNNRTMYVTIVKRPDLVTTQLSAFSDASPMIPGKPIYLWATIKNQGLAATPGIAGYAATPVSVGFYYVQNDQLIYIGKATIVGPSNQNPDVDIAYPLPPGGVGDVQCEQTWTPSAPGVYKIAAMVDYQGGITEEDENNNWNEMQVTVNATPPDLTPTNLVLIQKDQDLYNIKVTVANNGFSKANNVFVNLYYVYNSKDTLLDTLTINQMECNSKVDAIFDYEFSFTDNGRSPPSPTVTFKIIVDPDNKITESNESNNTKTYTFSY